jgi:hypothetical protein
MAELFKTYAKDYKEIVAEARDKLNKAKSLEGGSWSRTHLYGFLSARSRDFFR